MNIDKDLDVLDSILLEFYMENNKLFDVVDESIFTQKKK